jgi:O-antigen ligase
VFLIFSRSTGLAVDVAMPVLTGAWMGTTTMIVIASMVAATIEWQRYWQGVLVALLLPDAAALVMIIGLTNA